MVVESPHGDRAAVEGRTHAIQMSEMRKSGAGETVEEAANRDLETSRDMFLRMASKTELREGIDGDFV